MRGGIGVDHQAAAIVEKTRAAFVERFFSAPEMPRMVTPLLRLGVRGWIGFVEATALEWLERREISRDALVEMWISVLLATTGVAVD